MRSGFLSGGEAFEAPAVHEKNIQPAVVVVIIEGDTAASGLEKIFILVFAAENCFGVETGFARVVEKGHAKIVRKRNRRFESFSPVERCGAPPACRSDPPDLLQLKCNGR